MSKLSGENVIEVKFPFEFPNSVSDKNSFFHCDPYICQIWGCFAICV